MQHICAELSAGTKEPRAFGFLPLNLVAVTVKASTKERQNQNPIHNKFERDAPNQLHTTSNSDTGWPRKRNLFFDLTRGTSFRQLRLRSSLSIQPFEGSSLVRPACCL